MKQQDSCHLSSTSKVDDFEDSSEVFRAGDDAEGRQEDPQEEENPALEMSQKSRNRYTKAMIAIILIALVTFVVVDALGNGHVKDAVDALLTWIKEEPVAGIFVSTLVFMVATVLFVPGIILTLGAGFSFACVFRLGFGVLIGTLTVFIGASAGAIISFLLGRYLLRDYVVRLAKRYATFEALEIALGGMGFRIMSLLRLSPIIPFNIINYVLGVTSVSFCDYLLALFAVIPGTLLYVFLGASAGSLAESANRGDDLVITIIAVAFGVIFGVFAIALTSYYAKKELNKVILRRQSQDDAAVEESESCLQEQP